VGPLVGISAMWCATLPRCGVAQRTVFETLGDEGSATGTEVPPRRSCPAWPAFTAATTLST
jgi:hypothetical protein